jgi:serine/threonine protein phosphatase PrpC
MLKEKDVFVAVNPISNLKLASGVCNVPELLKRGINICIGTDSTASNNSLDFIEEMKIFAIAPKMYYNMPSEITVGDVLYAVNVGDSRLYLYNHGRLTQITRDHSLVQYLLDTGKLTKEEAKDYPNRNVITRAVGIERSIESDIFSVDLSRLHGDACAMLCSDGLSGYVEADDICSMLSSGIAEDIPYDGDAMAQSLVDAANAAGGVDNITVVLMRLGTQKKEEAKDDNA